MVLTNSKNTKKAIPSERASLLYTKKWATVSELELHITCIPRKSRVKPLNIQQVICINHIRTVGKKRLELTKISISKRVCNGGTLMIIRVKSDRRINMKTHKKNSKYKYSYQN